LAVFSRSYKGEKPKVSTSKFFRRTCLVANTSPAP
jgi:hypothetical protein